MKYQHDQFRELCLGDLVMVGKERWRRHVKGLDIEGFPKSWIRRGLREIHHVGDQMDGRMDACLGYTAVLGAEIYKSIGELKDELREGQKKRAFDGWDRLDTKRQLEDSLHDAQGEIADLKAWVDTLEFLVEKLTRPVPEVPKEATFRVASPPLPDIGFPPQMEIPGLTVNQTTVDEFLDWTSFDRSWPHGVTIFTFLHSFFFKVRSAQTFVQIMTWRYLILSYLFFSHFKVTPSRRGKQIVLENR